MLMLFAVIKCSHSCPTKQDANVDLISNEDSTALSKQKPFNHILYAELGGVTMSWSLNIEEQKLFYLPVRLGFSYTHALSVRNYKGGPGPDVDALAVLGAVSIMPRKAGSNFDASIGLMYWHSSETERVWNSASEEYDRLKVDTELYYSFVELAYVYQPPTPWNIFFKAHISGGYPLRMVYKNRYLSVIMFGICAGVSF
jgi:hypothetical protein